MIIESKFAVNCHHYIYFNKENKKNIYDWKASFVFQETIEAMLNLCLTVYLLARLSSADKIYNQFRPSGLGLSLFDTQSDVIPEITVWKERI